MAPAVAAVVEAALARLAKAGAVLVEVELDSIPGAPGEPARDLVAASSQIAAVLSAYESPRELASFCMTRSVPVPAAPKAEGEGGEEEAAAEEEEEEQGEGAAKKAKAPAPLVPLDSLVSVSKVFSGYKGPAPVKELLSAQLKHSTAVTASAYRSALVYHRPAVKRAFTALFKKNKLAAIVYPATLLAAAPVRGADGSCVELGGSLLLPLLACLCSAGGSCRGLPQARPEEAQEWQPSSSPEH
jgi:hypothetical protein